MAAAALPADEQRELAERYQGLRGEVDGLYSKLAAVDGDRSEVDLVLQQLEALDGARRCWHLVGAVLAEKTIADVVPVLRRERDRLEKDTAELTSTVTAREAELAHITRKYGIREVSASAAAAAAQ